FLSSGVNWYRSSATVICAIFLSISLPALEPRLFQCLDKLCNLPPVLRADLRTMRPLQSFAVRDHVEDVALGDSDKRCACQVCNAGVLFSHRAIAFALGTVAVRAVYCVKCLSLRDDRGCSVQRVLNPVGKFHTVLMDPVGRPALRISFHGIGGWHPHVHGMGV